LQQYFLPFP